MAPKIAKRAGRQSVPEKITQCDPVALRLSMFRVACGYGGRRQGEFARGARIPANAYSQYESGRRDRRITVEAALKLKQRYGLSLDWLYANDPSALPQRIVSAMEADPKSRDLLLSNQGSLASGA